jgi:hypothetical protein
MKTSYKAFEQTHKLPLYVRRAAEALIKCRTAELGGHLQACPEGHYQRQWYNSCRHRFCPQCNWIRIEQWLEKQKERILACGHYHMIFTMPHELGDIWLMNTKVMTDLLFTCIRDTLYEFFLDTRHIGGKPGIIATLHTWSQTMILHPHIHCLITEGGLANDRWMSTKQKGYLLPVKSVMAVFRGKLLDYINKAVENGMVTLPDSMTIQQWKNLKNKLGRTKWNVHIKERYDHGNGILVYLSRYIRGGATCQTGESSRLMMKRLPLPTKIPTDPKRSGWPSLPTTLSGAIYSISLTHIRKWSGITAFMHLLQRMN